MSDAENWVPEACTLPTADRPLRLAAFDALFSEVARFDRPEPTRLALALPRGLQAAARDLAERESDCCSFFTFDFELRPNDMVMHIGVPPNQIEVLDALQARLRR